MYAGIPHVRGGYTTRMRVYHMYAGIPHVRGGYTTRMRRVYHMYIVRLHTVGLHTVGIHLTKMFDKDVC